MHTYWLFLAATFPVFLISVAARELYKRHLRRQDAQ